jgi:hypothetical protein
MTVYTVRFCDKELVAHNLKDFARIAVFAKWYLRSQSIADGMQCSIEQKELPMTRNLLSLNRAGAAPAQKMRRARSTRTASMRKALRSFFYTVFY